MPNCPKCGQEVDPDQKMCAWCGHELGGSPFPKPTVPPPPPSTAPPSPASGPSVIDARELARRGDLEGATRLFLEILDRDPGNQEALFGIGGIHFKRGEYKKAIESWLKLKVLNPSYPKIDDWIEQAQKHLTPSSQSILEPAAPPPPPVSPPPSPSIVPSQKQAEPPSIPPSPGDAVEDWQKQSVRIEKIDEKALEEPPPKPAVENGETEIVGVGRDQTAVERWVVRVGWVLVAVYGAAVWWIYFT